VRDLNKARGWAIKRLCEIVDVERSAYYKWRNRKVTKREQLNQELCAIILEYFEESKHVLGFRTMTLRVNKLNQTGYNKKRIRRLMKLMGIASCIRRKRKGYVKSSPQVTAENVLNRRFEASQPDEKWLSDVTEFQIEGSRLFLCGIKDLCDKRVVSYRVALRNDNQLVFSTFDAAVSKHPQAKPLFHSDRGFQYTHRMFRQKLDHIGATQSMSRVGRCIDNGPMEGFWGTLKCEMKHLFPYHTKQELIHSIDQYIRYYNEQRCQEKLKGLTPMEYRAQAS
jgi:transposase InsO family protein